VTNPHLIQMDVK